MYLRNMFWSTVVRAARSSAGVTSRAAAYSTYASLTYSPKVARRCYHIGLVSSGTILQGHISRSNSLSRWDDWCRFMHRPSEGNDDPLERLYHEAVRGNPSAMYQLGCQYVEAYTDQREGNDGMDGPSNKEEFDMVFDQDTGKFLLTTVEAATSLRESQSQANPDESLSTVLEQGKMKDGIGKQELKRLKKEAKMRQRQRRNHSVYEDNEDLPDLEKAMISTGQVPTDLALAFQWIYLAAEAGHEDAMVQVGNMFLHGQGVQRDPESAREWYEKAATGFHHIDAHFNLGTMFYDGIGMAAPDMDEAVRHMSAAADQGDASAQFWLGHAYHQGIPGLTKDSSKGLNLIEMAAKSGHADALHYLALAFRSGDGVPADKDLAWKYMEEAADAGSGDALFYLGRCFFEGDGVEVDLRRAVEYFRKGSQLGHPDALTSMGAAYFNGLGVDVDYEKAYHLYNAASERSDINTTAWANLAHMYTHGLGTVKNMAAAQHYLDMVKYYTEGPRDGDPVPKN